MHRDGRLSQGCIGAVMAEDEAQAFDDTTGEELDLEDVKQARADEMGEVYKHEVYTKVPTQQCWERTGKAPIGVRWLDIH